MHAENKSHLVDRHVNLSGCSSDIIQSIYYTLCKACMEWTPILPFMIFRSLAHYRDILLFHGDLR